MSRWPPDDDDRTEPPIQLEPDDAPPPPLRFARRRRDPGPPAEPDAGGDNVIMMPGVASIPEPSPIRHGGPTVVPPEEDEGGAEGDTPDGLQPAPWQVVPAVEALLFAAEAPLTEARLDELLGRPGAEAIRGALGALSVRYGEGSGIRLVQVAKGWQLRTDPQLSRWVAALRGGRPVRLSRAALETLSIVAYRQPVTKAEIDELRGVDCGGVLRMLVDRGLVAVTGRLDEPGRPLVYGSTGQFLSMFGLRDLSDLPTLRDLRELQDDDPREGPMGQGGLGQQQLPLPPTGPVEDPGGPEDPPSS